jgi:hypothetical protein
LLPSRSSDTRYFAQAAGSEVDYVMSMDEAVQQCRSEANTQKCGRVTATPSTRRARPELLPAGKMTFRLLTRGQKRAAVERLLPLYYPDILTRVLSYVGPEQWLFLGAVSTAWCAAYRKVPAVAHDSKHILCEQHAPSCSTVTSRAHVFASASRVKAARAHGFPWDPPLTEFSWEGRGLAIAGAHGSRDALLAAKALGMPWTQHITRGVARVPHSLAKLQWLVTEAGCPWDAKALISAASYNGGLKHMHVLQYFLSEGCKVDKAQACYTAACNGSLDVLKWCRTQGYPWEDGLIGLGAGISGNLAMLQWLSQELHITWDDWDLQFMLQKAGLAGSLPACKWLRAQGAPFPTVLGDDIENYCWPGECLEWARSEGCDSPLFEPTYGSDTDSDGDANADAEEDE